MTLNRHFNNVNFIKMSVQYDVQRFKKLTDRRQLNPTAKWKKLKW